MKNDADNGDDDDTENDDDNQNDDDNEERWRQWRKMMIMNKGGAL